MITARELPPTSRSSAADVVLDLSPYRRRENPNLSIRASEMVIVPVFISFEIRPLKDMLDLFFPIDRPCTRRGHAERERCNSEIQ